MYGWPDSGASGGTDLPTSAAPITLGSARRMSRKDKNRGVIDDPWSRQGAAVVAAADVKEKRLEVLGSKSVRVGGGQVIACCQGFDSGMCIVVDLAIARTGNTKGPPAGGGDVESQEVISVRIAA